MIKREERRAGSSQTILEQPGELDEVADVIVTVLRATTPATSTAKAKYELDAQIAEAGRRRCADLLARHRLYPEIEL